MENDRIYNQGVVRLRSPERMQFLEADKTTSLIIDKDIKSILDIGTGSGIFAEKFSECGVQVTGIDINQEMLDAAKELVPKANFQIGAAEKLPFMDNSFDLAFMGLVFHEVNDYTLALSEAFRVSKIGVSILEWKYEVEDYGPPLEHRLKKEFILQLAKIAGFATVEAVQLKNLILYKLKK